MISNVKIEPVNNQSWRLFPVACHSFCRKIAHITDIVITEGYTNLRYSIIASITWIWRKYIRHEIRTISLQATFEGVTKVAYLNVHGKFRHIEKKAEVFPVLVSHGDYGHPFTLLHLTDIAQNQGLLTFSLYIPGVQNNKELGVHNLLLKKAIDVIEDEVRVLNGKFAGILGAGHSKGAIILAQKQFVDLDSRIKATCAIGGRLNIPNEGDCSDRALTSIVKSIYLGIVKNSRLPLVQIVPKDDWNASQEAMMVRPHDHCYRVPGKHFSGLYERETREYFTRFLKEFSVC